MRASAINALDFRVFCNKNCMLGRFYYWESEHKISASLEVMISSLGSFWSAWGSLRAHPELKCFKDSWKRYNSREVEKSRAFSRKISNLSCTSWLTMPYRLALRFRKRLHRDLPCPTAPLYSLLINYIAWLTIHYRQIEGAGGVHEI